MSEICANHLKGSKLWQLLKSLSQILLVENSVTGRAYMGESADTNLAGIHEEMSKLLDKQNK